MLNQQENLYLKLQEDGYAVVRNVLSLEEIEYLRKTLKAHFWDKGSYEYSGMTQPNAAIEIPELSWLFYHPQILKSMRQALGDDDIVFTSHCDAHMRTLARWHKDDNPDGVLGSYFGKPTYDLSDCRVYKIAVYLQDHSNNCGGLSVRRRSHRFHSLTDGEEVYLSTKPGDIIIFDVRITHKGQIDGPITRVWKRVYNAFEAKVKAILNLMPQAISERCRDYYCTHDREKMGIFFTFGLNNQHTLSFSKNNMKRQLTQTGNTDAFLATDLRKKFLENNISLIESEFKVLASR